MADEAGGFLSRWARRKAQVRGDALAAPQPAPPAASATAATAVVAEPVPAAQSKLGDALPDAPAHSAEALPTMADVALLTRDSDYSRFVLGGVDEGVKRAAMKKLFSDPHFNVMDGLDTYIDDYGKPDPLPAGMLRKMLQSQALGLFDDEKTADAASAAADARLDAPSRTEPAAGGPSAAPDA